MPITADQDKYLALQRIVTDIYKATGKVSNPVSFSSAELLKSLGLADAGKNFHEVGEWLNLMYSTTIISEGVVYFAGKKKWVTDRFRVFNRAVSVGGELEPGVTAEKNYVWFSDWQLENINNNHLLPIDHETYNQLKNHIAKILVPLLQIWLYATRDKGSFEKRYEELSEILNIHQYHQPSRIKEQLASSLDELKAYGYLADWKIEKTSDNKHYKIVFYHGEKFHRDRRRRLAAKEITSEQNPTETTDKEDAEVISEHPSEQGIDRLLLAELTRRGVVRGEAIKLLQSLEPGQPLDHDVSTPRHGRLCGSC